ncbi:MAG: ATP synthase F1 subunit gamma [Deltaproteobacteria bacterium]|nr:ATP synthase F1 subunit gamma [Deltaproteobacteria bacterium]
MPSLRDIKRRIKSVKNTRQITKAMKMVSAAKLKKAQDDINAARPYAEKMLDFVNSLASKTTGTPHPLMSSRAEVKNLGVLLLTSDRGLCGGFNTAMLRAAESFLREHREAKISLGLIGKRGMEYFKRREITVINSRPAGSGRPDYAAAAASAEEMMRLFTGGELDEVYVIYSEFKSVINQKPVVHKLLPITPPAPEKAAEGEGAAKDLSAQPEIPVIYEPSVDAVLSGLLPKYVEIQLFRAMLESSASEHGARMTSMDSASKNASEMIGSLTLKYNRLRQAAITKELMEIIGGAEALK